MGDLLKDDPNRPLGLAREGPAADRFDEPASPAHRGSDMYCQQCGKELPPNSLSCPACGFKADPPRSASSSSTEDVVADLKHSAKELVRATAKLTQRAAEKADVVANDPKGSAKRVSRKVSEELDKAAKEVDRILREL